MAAFKLTEMKANLFHMPQTYSLAHAVSADLDVVRGTLAWQMGVIFGQVDDLRQQQAEAGSMAVLEDNARFIYYLITKENSYEKCTYGMLQAAFICMREHMRNHEIMKVAMPRIGCGNDRLDWQRVRDIIREVFANDYNVEIVICEHRSPLTTTPRYQINEVKGNLFSAPSSHSLVHSISADFAMYKGIALQFKCKFGQVNELLKQNKHTGSVAVLKDNDRYIYNLVTKERSHDKCTYPALYYALVAMRDHMLHHGVTKLAIPRLGCGIDRLDWLHVKKVLELVFAEDDVEIIAYFYDPPMVVAKSHITVHSPSCKRSI